MDVVRELEEIQQTYLYQLRNTEACCWLSVKSQEKSDSDNSKHLVLLSQRNKDEEKNKNTNADKNKDNLFSGLFWQIKKAIHLKPEWFGNKTLETYDAFRSTIGLCHFEMIPNDVFALQVAKRFASTVTTSDAQEIVKGVELSIQKAASITTTATATPLQKFPELKPEVEQHLDSSLWKSHKDFYLALPLKHLDFASEMKEEAETTQKDSLYVAFADSKSFYKTFLQKIVQNKHLGWISTFPEQTCALFDKIEKLENISDWISYGQFLQNADLFSLVMLLSLNQEYVVALKEILKSDPELFQYVMCNFHILGLLFLCFCLQAPMTGIETFSQSLIFLSVLAGEIQSHEENETRLKQIYFSLWGNDGVSKKTLSLSDQAWDSYSGFFFSCSKGWLDGHLYSDLPNPEVRLVKMIASKVMCSYPKILTLYSNTPVNFSEEDTQQEQQGEKYYWKRNPLQYESAIWFHEVWSKQIFKISISLEEAKERGQPEEEEEEDRITCCFLDAGQTAERKEEMEEGEEQQVSFCNSQIWKRQMNPSCFLKEVCASSPDFKCLLEKKIKIVEPHIRKQVKTKMKFLKQFEDKEKGGEKEGIQNKQMAQQTWTYTTSSYYSYGTAYVISILVFTVLLILFLIFAMMFTSPRMFRKYTVQVDREDVAQDEETGQIRIINPIKLNLPSNTILYSLG